tara:strand:+ start:513 stop:932 length:420 start_codon:yes stop_codon:yes gene_type:complete
VAKSQGTSKRNHTLKSFITNELADILESYTLRWDDITARSIPMNKDRLQRSGFNNHKNVDPIFFDESQSFEARRASEIAPKFIRGDGGVSGKNSESGRCAIWINYDPKDPTEIKCSIYIHRRGKLSKESQSLTKHGILG